MTAPMRAMMIIMIGSSIFIGAAMVRGISYALTHAMGIVHDDARTHPADK